MVNEEGYGGAAVWALDLDDYLGVCGKRRPLLTALNDALTASSEISGILESSEENTESTEAMEESKSELASTPGANPEMYSKEDETSSSEEDSRQSVEKEPQTSLGDKIILTGTTSKSWLLNRNIILIFVTLLRMLSLRAMVTSI